MSSTYSIMSLLNFFAQQRKHWRSQSDDKSVENLAGGLAALDQAEVAFKATPIYNAHQQVADVQRELDEVSYQLSLARKEIKNLKSKLGSMTQQASAVVVEQQLVAAAKLHRKRAQTAHKVLRKVAATAIDLCMRPNTKLLRIVEIVSRFQATLQKESGEVE